MKEVISLLKDKTIATMESCTGGYIANEITNIKGASKVLKYSCVTYSNDFKIKMGVSKELIDTYTEYHELVAKDMAYKISLFSDSDYGIGITGNLTNVNDIVYVSIFDKKKNNYKNFTYSSETDNRIENKKQICNLIIIFLKKFV